MKRLPFFVYGTLLPDQPNYDLLAEETLEQRTAYFPDGRLYDLGPYPMLLEGDGRLVKGVVYTIKESDYPTILHRLDALEGFDPQNPSAGDYRRVERQVKLEDARSVKAWVYLGKQSLVSGANLIRSGDWVAYTRKYEDKIAAWWAKWRFGKTG
jgi:gamma-glutamylcyclotransferase (GGCT)/AIG2-like uncharacterized protein YtfP